MIDKLPGLNPEFENPEFEKVCGILDSIHQSFPDGSEQGKAIQEASEAYLFLQLHVKLRRAYAVYRQAGLEGLTDEQEQFIPGVGADLDEE